MNRTDFFYDVLAYWRTDDSDEATQIVKDYENVSLKELFSFYHNVSTRSDIPEDEKNLRVRILRLCIAKKLDLVDLDRFEYFVETAIGEIDQIETDIENLTKQFKNHRHSLDKTYGEKPNW